MHLYTTAIYSFEISPGGRSVVHYSLSGPSVQDRFRFCFFVDRSNGKRKTAIMFSKPFEESAEQFGLRVPERIGAETSRQFIHPRVTGVGGVALTDIHRWQLVQLFFSFFHLLTA